jgi:flagellar hook protein FlgE
MPFQAALSGLNAASSDLKVTGNNIANAATVGFKQSRAEFADVFSVAYAGMDQTAIGSGVRLASVTQQFGQGAIDFTGNGLDLALSGQGFFVLNDPNGARSYSRDGTFRMDRDGYVVNNGGARVQAYPIAADGSGIINRGALADLRLSATEASPQASSRVDAEFNLSSNAADVSGIPFNPGDPASYSFSTSLGLFDSLGQSHTASLYFRNVGPLAWEANLTIDGNPVGGAQPLRFGPDGTLTEPLGGIRFGAYSPGNGAADLDVEFDFSGATQYGEENSVTSLSQDGYSSGRLTGVDIDDSGIVLARFTNGQSVQLGQVALANFANPQGLQSVGGNAWIETYAAGDPVLGAAGEGDFGSIQSGGLESSNVDIASQLVNLITAQRNFQANAQVISTADEVTQAIINLR